MRSAVHAEWTKLRTVAGPRWLLLATAVVTVALSAVVDAALTCPPGGCAIDATKVSLTGIQLGQAVVAVLAVLVIGDEYRNGMIQTTLAAMPRRPVVLLAKAAVLLGPVLVAGAVGAVGSIVAGRIILPGHGFTVSLGDPATLRATAGSVLYLALVALLSLGLATLVRDSAVAIGLVLGLLYLFPIVIGVVSNPHWERRLRQLSPGTAGLSIQDTIAQVDPPLSPWAGLGVLALWAAGALLAGGLALRLRDA